MLLQWWATVPDGGPPLERHWVIITSRVYWPIELGDFPHFTADHRPQTTIVSSGYGGGRRVHIY